MNRKIGAIYNIRIELPVWYMDPKPLKGHLGPRPHEP